MARRILTLLTILNSDSLFAQTDNAHEGDDTRLRVYPTALSQAPVLDGDSSEWLAQGAQWSQPLPTMASTLGAMDSSDSRDWDPQPQIMSGIYGDKIYFAIRWQDENEDNIYKPWIQRSKKFRRNRKKDDMLALRFHTSGEFDECMLAGSYYTVDLWRWSAGRSQLAGIADDMQHVISNQPLEMAAVHQTPNGSIYIKNIMDDGEAGWSYARRPDNSDEMIVPGVVVDNKPSGSRADVSASGRWNNGSWVVEISRQLKTSDPSDIDFLQAEPVTGQLAFFNAGYNLRKRVTAPLLFTPGAAQANVLRASTDKGEHRVRN